MAQYKDVELTDGRTVRVYRSPSQRFIDMVAAKDPEPVVPIMTEINVTGRAVSLPIPSDPDYLQALNEWNQRGAARDEEVRMLEALAMFRDVEVPETWKAEEAVGDIALFADPTWVPREGAMGRKLDYIQWEILGDVIDTSRVQEARLELSGFDMKEIQAITASFRDQVEGKAD